MFLMIVDGMLSAPDQTGLLKRSLEGCQYTKRRRSTAGHGEEALCAAHEYDECAGCVTQGFRDPGRREDVVDKNGWAKVIRVAPVDERGLVTWPGDAKRHREHDVAGVTQTACMAWDRKVGGRVGRRGEGNTRRQEGTRKEDTRKHTRDIHCILNIVDVGCDTDIELALMFPSRRIGDRMANAWHGLARHGTALWVCLCFLGQSESGCWVVPRRLPRTQGLGKKRSKQPPRPPKRFPRVLTSRPWSNQKRDQIVSKKGPAQSGTSRCKTNQSFKLTVAHHRRPSLCGL